MMTFYVCRHGQTENNVQQRFSGWIDTPLTEQGVRDALSAAAKLRDTHFDKLMSSDLGRALTTAYLIARQLGYGGEIERLRDLREVNYGDLANLPYASYPKVSPSENTHFAPPHGESLAQMQQRVLDCVRKLSLENSNKTILLVAHDGTINALKADFTGQEMGVVDLTHNAHDFVGKFEYDDRVVTFEEVR